ncbi:FAD-binding protein [Alteromonas sp. ASW11-19]|uniref:FAD-binding protein n=1 Tax=Alteromonas salexigens TaxID=2982530 RepID=A0ABT2VQQ4_9ALTE|nr:FAD-binding protein [Alteromonas salexigens]MCU7555642.1 FAD-binding protein [Alteromonas salexigens]
MTLQASIEQVLSSSSSYSEDPTATARFARSPEGFTRNIRGVVSIGATDDIQAMLKLANAPETLASNPFAIFPVSTGNNWGYGTGLPETDDRDAVILDLSALSNVTYFDEEDGICSLQPGVTQQRLYEFLQSKGSDYMVPVTGAGPSCSVLANALERGYGITPGTDHFATVTCIKGYLPTGEFYESSLAAMDQTSDKLVDKAFKWKHGPYLDGLFTQSGNMVVTEVTLVLEKPKDGFDSFYMRFYKPDSFADAYLTVKSIFQSLGAVVGSINLMDRRRVAAMVSENPQGPGTHQNMTDEQLDDIAKRHQVPHWTVVGTIYAPKSVSRAARKEIAALAAGRADEVLFSSGIKIKFGQWLVKHLPFSFLTPVKEQLEKLEMGMQIMKGIPNQIALPLAYWRNPRVRPDGQRALNPAEDGCGILWYAPLVPAKVPQMELFIAMVRRICATYNIEPMVTFTNFSAHCTDSTIPIVFDRENPAAVADAQTCLNKLFEEGIKNGFVPYRMNIEQQQQIDKAAPFWKAAKQINTSLDSNNILSPGRYDL